MTILGVVVLTLLILRLAVRAHQRNAERLAETERQNSALANQRTIGVLEGRERPNSAITVAIIRREPKEYDGLGPIGIVREAHKLWSTHFRFFCWIQVTLILPFAIVVVASLDWLMGRVFDQEESPRVARTAPCHRGVGHIIAKVSQSDLAVQGVVFVGIVIVITVAYEAAVSLFSSAIVYAVGLHYTDQSVSVVDVLRVSVPRLWMRLTVTKIYHSLLWFAMYLVGFAGLMLLSLYEAPKHFLMLESSLSTLVTWVGAVYLDMIFMPAGSVSVLEQDYGWAAVRRSLNLLKGKLMAALRFQLLWFLPSLTLAGFQFKAQIFPRIHPDEYSGATQLILTTLYIVYMTYFLLLKALCAGIQYATFKAYHHEEVGESMYKSGTVNDGYEPLGSTIEDQNKGGNQADMYV